MGAYVSKAQCKSLESVVLNCTNWNQTWYDSDGTITGVEYFSIGDVTKHNFPPNPDVAGIGIFSAFSAVSFFALAISGLYLLLQMLGWMEKNGMSYSIVRPEGYEKPSTEDSDGSSTRSSITWAQIFEALIISCSDQQVFTSGAYALTLRYAQGCKTSAYHYNIIANMMLMTCATHLMSVTVVGQYWKHRALAIFRIMLVTGLFLVTALLLSNQNVHDDLRWPTDVPNKSDNGTLLVLPAACFQVAGGTLMETAEDSVKDPKHFALGTIANSSPNNRVVGWNFFVLMLIWYASALLAEVFKLWFHGSMQCFRRTLATEPRRRRRDGRRCNAIIKWAFCVYQSSGMIFSSVAVVYSYLYIRKLRTWMNESEWLKREDDGSNAENDATSFGQLVPILLTLLTVFTFIELLGDKFSELRKNRRAKKEAVTAAASAYTPLPQTPSAYNGYFPDKKPSVQTMSVASTPMTDQSDPLLQSVPIPAPYSPHHGRPVMSPTHQAQQTQHPTMSPTHQAFQAQQVQHVSMSPSGRPIMSPTHHRHHSSTSSFSGTAVAPARQSATSSNHFYSTSPPITSPHISYSSSHRSASVLIPPQASQTDRGLGVYGGPASPPSGRF